MKTLILYPLVLLLGLVACKKDPVDPCIDPSLITGGACYLVYDPVCGCDGKTYPNDCVAEKGHGITSFTPGECDCSYPYRGEIVDYTGLDGCGLMVKLDNDKLLEPVSWPADFTPSADMHIEFNYREITSMASICMAGTMAEIVCVRPGQSCFPIDSAGKHPVFHRGGFQDPVEIESAEIRDDCLHIKYSNGGGCAQHEYKLVQQPLFSGTPPAPDLLLQFMHEGNGDLCQALLSGERSYDLLPLRQSHTSELEIQLFSIGDGNKPLVLKYKY